MATLTRGRSRSKTPSINLRVSSDREINVEKLTIKQPDVETISEENTTSTSTKVALVSVTKTVSNDITVDDVRTSNSTPTPPQIEKIEVVKRTLVTRHNEYPIIATETVSVANNKTEKRDTIITQEENISTEEAINSSLLQKEVIQNEINKIVEDYQTATSMITSTPKRSSSSRSIIATEIVSPQGDLKEHVAYKEYKDAGEYWNKYPKTDYTYSELSPDRREIAPGVIAMPNMSRKSLDKHHVRVKEMIARNPKQESFIRQRYVSSALSRNVTGYDSQDEVDLSELTRAQTYTRSTVRTTESTTIVRKFFMSIITFFISIPHAVSRVFKRSEHNLYYTRIEDDKGVVRKMISYLKYFFRSIFTKLYLIISSILCLDTWLLQRLSASSTKSSLEEKSNKKRKALMGLLILLPFLLFGAMCLADKNDKIILPSSAKSPVSLGLALPSLPQTLNIFLKLTSLSSHTWLDSFYFPSITIFSEQSTQKQPSNEKLKISLAESEYSNLMKHIESYVENKLNEKYQRENFNINFAEINEKIANAVGKTIQMYKYELNELDINMIAEKVKESLKDILVDNSKKPVVLSKDNIEQITNLINNHLHVEQNQLVIDEQQMKDILLTVLSSGKLIEVIDLRILEKLKQTQSAEEDQKILIENVRKELSIVQAQYDERMESNFLRLKDDLKNQFIPAQLTQSLIPFLTNQEKLADQILNYEKESVEKNEKFRNDMEMNFLNWKEQQTAEMNNIVKTNILSVLNEKSISDENVKAWVQNLFVAKDYLEAKLKELNLNMNNVAYENIKNLGQTLMQEIAAQLKSDMLMTMKEKTAGNVATGVSINEIDVKRIVREALAIYDADKTGLVDYALESAGGQILSTRCTENFHTRSAQISIFGIPLWYPTNTPRTVIKPSMQPGECWAFQGFPGYLVIQLNSEVLVTGFTMEHIPKMLAPNGQIDSAPSSFSVWGLKVENDDNPVLFGNYQFLDNNSSLQYFPVQNKDVQLPFRLIELRIESNHGNRRYTCLYRFRVHGSRI